MPTPKTLADHLVEVVQAIGADIKSLFGRSVPAGGAAGQTLAKNSSTSYDMVWVDMPEGIDGFSFLHGSSPPGASVEYTLLTTQVPTSQADESPYELGTKFLVTESGKIHGIRFYKAFGETLPTTRVGNLWGPTGLLMGSVTFTSETASGWQEARFTAPISVVGGTVYTVSVNTTGKYPYTAGGFNSPISNSTIYSAGSTSGVFATSVGAYPDSTFGGNNYFRDAIFVPDSISATVEANPGDKFINLLTGDVYVKGDDGNFTLSGNLRGPTGATGATGANGTNGVKGDTGNTGPQGPAAVDTISYSTIGGL